MELQQSQGVTGFDSVEEHMWFRPNLEDCHHDERVDPGLLKESSVKTMI